jgi:hypothetical protein
MGGMYGRGGLPDWTRRRMEHLLRREAGTNRGGGKVGLEVFAAVKSCRYLPLDFRSASAGHRQQPEAPGAQQSEGGPC